MDPLGFLLAQQSQSRSQHFVMTEFELQAGDGYRLAARIYEAHGPHRGAVLIVPAMAVGQDYYAAFASWLADREWRVVTFDFRGIGASAPKKLRGFQADILCWARLDCAAALAKTRELACGRPLLWIGHSLGGQILAMTPGVEALSAAVTVASGVGYWKENAYPLRRYSWWLWHVIAPLATALFDYFPGKRLRMVGDLPRGVMDQWSRWCKNPEYAVGVEGADLRESYRKVTLPLLSLSFTDRRIHVGAQRGCSASFLRERAPRHAPTLAAGRGTCARRALRFLPRGNRPQALADRPAMGKPRDLISFDQEPALAIRPSCDRKA